MKSSCVLGVVLILAAPAALQADPILQFDVSSFTVQATNSAGTGTPFGGLTHTGSLVNMGFNGSLSNFSDQINMVNGQLSGGLLIIAVNGVTDTFTANTGGAGHFEAYVGGGFRMEGLVNSASDAQFARINDSNWFNHTLFGGSFDFNWNANAGGSGSGEMDTFVDVVPLPPAAWAGLTMLGGLHIIRKRRQARA